MEARENKREITYFIFFVFFSFLLFSLLHLFIAVPLLHRIVLHPSYEEISRFFKIYIYYTFLNALIFTGGFYFILRGIFGKKLNEIHSLLLQYEPDPGGEKNLLSGKTSALQAIKSMIEENRQVKKENAQLKEELRELKNELMSSEKIIYSGKFISSLAHELKSPVGALKGYVEMLKMEKDSSSNLSLIDKISQTLERIERALNDSMESIRFSEAKEDVIFSLEEEIEKVLNSLNAAGILKERAVVTHFHDKYKIKGDREIFRRLISNLITNAVEATERRGKIEIIVRSSPFEEPEGFYSPEKGIEKFRIKKGDEVIYLEIIDNGKGIRKEKMDKIFEPFYTDKKGKNTGLGLFVVKEALRVFHGRIFVKSEEGRGTHFILTLPIIL